MRCWSLSNSVFFFLYLQCEWIYEVHIQSRCRKDWKRNKSICEGTGISVSRLCPIGWIVGCCHLWPWISKPSGSYSSHEGLGWLLRCSPKLNLDVSSRELSYFPRIGYHSGQVSGTKRGWHVDQTSGRCRWNQNYPSLDDHCSAWERREVGWLGCQIRWFECTEQSIL